MRNRRMVGALYGLAIVVVAIVAAAAAKMTYGHTVHVGVMVGEPDARLLPVSIDGMVLAGTIMMAVDRLRGYKSRVWAVVGVTLGTVMLISSNVGSAWSRGFWACVVSAIPAVAFFVAVEIIFKPSRTLLQLIVAEVPVEAPVAVMAPVPVPAVVPVPVPATPEPEPVSAVPAPVIEPTEAVESPMESPPTPRRRRSPSSNPGAGRRKPTRDPAPQVFEVVEPDRLAIEQGPLIAVPAFSSAE